MTRAWCAAQIFALLAAARVEAATPTPERWSDIVTMAFHNLTPDNGLPTGGAPTALAQDGQGFIWLGTQNGLMRWDGYRFRRYAADRRRTDALPDDFVRCLHTDPAGRLWIGTRSGGLARFDRDRERFVHYSLDAAGADTQSIEAITDDGAGGLWIATGVGAGRLDPASGRFRPLHPDAPGWDGPIGSQIASVFHDSGGALWVGGAAGLARRAPGAAHFTRVSLPVAGRREAQATVLFEDDAKRLWIGAAADGAFVIERPGAVARRVREDASVSKLDTEQVKAFVQSGPNQVWIATHGQGVVAVDTRAWTTRRLQHDPLLAWSIADDGVWTMLRDRSGLVWLGTGRSLSWADPRRSAISSAFGATSLPRGVSGADVASMTFDPRGRLWLGLRTGEVDVIDPVRGRLARRPASLMGAAAVTALAATPSGRVFIATNRELVWTDGPSGATHRLAVAGVETTHVRSLLYRDGVLWVGATGLGALRLDRRGIATGRLTVDPRMSGRRVTTFAAAANDELWVGSLDGLDRVDAQGRLVERIASGASAATLASPAVQSLLIDAVGRLWVGTLGGLDVMIGRSAGGRPVFRYLGVEEGLRNVSVDEVLPGNDGHVWAATDDGLAVIDPATFAIAALGRADGVAIDVYWVNSGLATAQGELLFGGRGGLTIVRPRLAVPWRFAPPLAITDVRVGGRATRPDAFGQARPLTIEPNANSLSVEFAALDYSAPETNRYAYILQGHDRAWTLTDATRRVVTVTDLDPGRYTLRIRGTGRDGRWSPTEVALPIVATPAWWRTWWFEGALALGACALIYGLVQFRTAALKNRQRELERLVDARTAELACVAYLDPLTGLENRRRFTGRLNAALAAGRGCAFALILFDLDHFKAINDTRGHDVGDAVLVETAARLRAALPEGVDIARLGGDEFAMLVACGADRDAAATVCGRIVDAFAAPMHLETGEVAITPSVGVALWPEDAQDLPSLYKAADVAMYAAKRGGRNLWRRFDAGDGVPLMALQGRVEGSAAAAASRARRGAHRA